MISPQDPALAIPITAAAAAAACTTAAALVHVKIAAAAVVAAAGQLNHHSFSLICGSFSSTHNCLSYFLLRFGFLTPILEAHAEAVVTTSAMGLYRRVMLHMHSNLRPLTV